MSHTPGPLTVRISDKWPFAIETVNASGEVVFTDDMPCHSSKDRTAQDAIDCVHFRFSEREQYSEMNKRAIADAVLRAAAPELLEELQARVKNDEQSAFEDWLRITCPSGDVESVQRQWEESSLYSDFLADTAKARAAIAKALGEPQ